MIENQRPQKRFKNKWFKSPAHRNSCFAFLLIASFMVSGCKDREPPPGDPSATKDKTAGSVAAVLSSVWTADSLFAMGPEGKRSLAPGDPVFMGESIHTGAGLKATLRLGSNVTAQLHQNSVLELASLDGVSGLALKQGQISISRPMGAPDKFPMKLGHSVFNFSYGRVFARADTNGGILRVEAGEISAAETGKRHLPGETIQLATHGKAQTEPSETVALPPAPAPLTPLTPEALLPAKAAPVLRGIGTLTARTPGSGRKSENALDLTEHSVKVTIRDGVALTEIEEAFTNHSNRTVEGTYRFMIPSRASITRLALDVNGRIEEGEVLEKKRAKRIFKQIVEDSVRPKDPALLEWERGSSFRMKIFPIKGKETRRVYISYMEPLTEHRGYYKYIYPLGGPAGTPAIGTFRIHSDIHVQSGVRQLTTPLYQSHIEPKENGAVVRFQADKYVPTTDYVLQFAAESASDELRLATQTDKDGQTYVMALLNPRFQDLVSTASKRVIVVVDTSYGISKEILALANATVVETLANLSQDDTFTVLACDDSCARFSPNFEKTNLETLRQVHAFLASIEPGGASNLLGAFNQAFTLARDGKPTTVVYLGDGVPTSGEMTRSNLLALLSKIRPTHVAVQTVGLGPNVDGVVLDAMGAMLGGSSYQLSMGESCVDAAWELSRRIHVSGLNNVEITWPAGMEAAYPVHIGSIPKGAQVALTAKLHGPAVNGDLMLRGQLPDGQTVERKYPISIASTKPEAGFIKRLWAKAHIDHLSLNGGDDKEMITVSRTMRVASPLTSWIVLENQRMYDRFNVERTDAERWQGEEVAFASVEAAEDSDQQFDEEIGDDSLKDMAGIDSRVDSVAGGGAGAGAMRSRAPMTRAPRPSAKPAKMKKKMAMGSGEMSYPGDFEEYRPPPPPYVVSIKRPSKPSRNALKRIEQYEYKVKRFPMSRTNHRRFVRSLARLGKSDDARKAATEWVHVDPLSTSALVSLADQVARSGNRAGAMRLYASVSELHPTSPKIHVRVARAFRDMGNYQAAAGHFKAAAISKKGASDALLDYLISLAQIDAKALLDAEADEVLASRKHRSIHKKVRALINAFYSGEKPFWPRKRCRGKLTVKMTLDRSDADLDIAIIDPTGRRISGVWRKGASSIDLTSLTTETLAIHGLMNGSYKILVSRTDNRTTTPVRGKLRIKIMNKGKTLRFTLDGADMQVAVATYKKRPIRHYYR